MVEEHLQKGEIESLDVSVLDKNQQALRKITHQTIAKVTDDIQRRYTFNTAIAAVMELLNAVGKFDDNSAQGKAVCREALESAVLLLSPIVPHASHSLWLALGNTSVIIDTPWPKVDEAALASDSVELMVQVNGKLRSKIEVATDADKSAIETQALAEENVQKFIEGKEIKRVIVVPGRLVNIVVK